MAEAVLALKAQLRQPDEEEVAVRKRSLLALDGLNFFVADMLTGFGPFVTVYLVAHSWSQSDIGLALSVGTVAALLGQVPAGLLVDAVRYKRVIIGIGVLAVIVASLLFAWFPNRWPVFGIETLIGLSGALLTPAIAAITLTLAKYEKLGVRLGGNVRYKALGSAVAALAMGYIGDHVSTGAVFYVSALFGVVALGCLTAISNVDVKKGPKRTQHFSAWPHRERPRPPARKQEIWRSPELLAFAACMFLFQLGNAAALPFAFSVLGEHTHANGTDLAVSYALNVSQLVVAAVSPSAGRLAHTRGRKAVLFVGLALLVVRCLVLAVTTARDVVIGLEVLDGLTGAVIGVMVPLVVADITHQGGRFNFAMGLVGVAMGLGAALSTVMTGFMVQHVGPTSAFLSLAAAAAAGCVAVMTLLPETARHSFPIVWKRGSPTHAV
ncbi:MAG: MFS transporter [Acetobacteraceae bacterium]|nr:MFS transporter [Acetobacteraceae bacterium]